jgi:protein SCO1/2
MKRLWPLLALLLAGAAPLDDPTTFAWQQRPGAHLPLDTQLRDEHGRPFRLGDAFAGAPVILDLGYFHCPALCGLVRAGLIEALRASGLAARDYALVSLSIDPTEQPADAARAKAVDLGQLGAAADWHYLTGTPSAIAVVADAVGFRDRYDAQFRQFLHPVGLAVLTGDGVVSSYLLGVGYGGGDLRAAILRAHGGVVARATLPVLLLCFHYDPATGRYTLAILKLLRLMGGLTVLTLGGLLLLAHRHRREAAR